MHATCKDTMCRHYTETWQGQRSLNLPVQLQHHSLPFATWSQKGEDRFSFFHKRARQQRQAQRKSKAAVKVKQFWWSISSKPHIAKKVLGILQGYVNASIQGKPEERLPTNIVAIWLHLHSEKFISSPVRHSWCFPSTKHTCLIPIHQVRYTRPSTCIYTL